MKQFTSFILYTCLLFIFIQKAQAQFGKLPPFQLQMQAINGTNIPGLHSFAFAQAGDKWLFIGGRTNGLHGLNSNSGFPLEYRNEAAVVIDTTTWNFYQADLNQLPKSIADPMRSTNMQSIQNGDYLYMIGGFGWDSIQDGYATFPTLTAIHVSKMIDAVINSKPISSSIRQLRDTNLMVCGGELGKLGNDYYLMYGHNFNGTYDDKLTILFTQVYSNRIKKFNLQDNGTILTLSNFSSIVDTVNFHRRDLTSCPLIKPDGSAAIGSYGGVFKKNANMPYLEPIILSANGTAEVKSYQQVMSQYTCAVLPVYDAVKKDMYTTFFGGISLNDYNPATFTIKRDTILPFISDVTTLCAHENGNMEETVLPLQLPGLLGCNAKFILNKSIASYPNEVVDLKQLATKQQLVGYIIGGIRAQAGNFGMSTANNVIYRVYLTPTGTSGINEIDGIVRYSGVFPNPSSADPVLELSLKEAGHIRVSLTDLMGKELKVITNGQLQKGTHSFTLDVSDCKAGLYLCEIQSATGKIVHKIVVDRQ